MIDGRTTELLKYPEKILREDLQMLQNEIAQHPYIQSLRAVYLYGIHRYQPEDFKNILTETAAYTTDKKILYSFINREDGRQKEIVETPADAENFSKENIVTEEHPESEKEVVEHASYLSFHEVEPLAREIDEEKKSIDEAEYKETPDAENFSKENIVTEEHPESEKEVVEHASYLSFHEVEPLAREIDEEKKSIDEAEYKETPDAENFSKENIVTEEHPESEKEVVEHASYLSFHEVEPLAREIDEEKKSIDESEYKETPDAESFTEELNMDMQHPENKEKELENSADLSFHGIHEFMPDVRISSAGNISATPPVSHSSINRHEDEMQRLIAEVEAKMKAARKNTSAVLHTPSKPEEPQCNSIDFVENYGSLSPDIQRVEATESKDEEVWEDKISPSEIERPETADTEWRPMSVQWPLPDRVPEPEVQEKKPEISENQYSEVSGEERPVLNVSFFSEELKPITEDEIPESVMDKNSLDTESETESSNVPHFINTWQNWLKLDKSDSALVSDKQIVEEGSGQDGSSPEDAADNKKQKAIETFIETNPKISRVNKDADFTVKEKEDDISHLMTETLAGLYVTQKLYSKAIAAYETLIAKYPEKEDYFRGKILEVREIKTGK